MNQRKKDLLIIGISIIIITLLHYFTISTGWDIHDFYRRLYYIPIILSAFKFRLKGGIITPLIISILYAPHLLIYFGKIDINVFNQFLEIIMFMIIGVVTGFWVESDFRKKLLLEVQIKKITDLENYTRNILDSITNVVFATDRNLKIQSMNKEGFEIFGLVNNNKELKDIFIDYHKVHDLLKDVLKNEGFPKSIETKCKAKNHKIIDVKLLIYPLRNIINKTEGLVIILEDISEIKKLENQVRRAEKLSAVGELASGVAHEIRNPMGIIKTISQTIYKETSDENIKEGLEIIIQEVDRANKVIKELLDYAKPSVHQIKLYSLNKLIEEVLLIINKYAQQHKVVINYNTEEDIRLLLDSEKLKQGFINILFNAIQAMPEGGYVSIDIDIKEKWVQIIFEDNGIGIPDDKIEKIFEPFYTTKEHGTGLGLAITHRIIEEHKGYIEIESKVGVGTKVRIYLPITQGGGEYDEKHTYS